MKIHENNNCYVIEVPIQNMDMKDISIGFYSNGIIIMGKQGYEYSKENENSSFHTSSYSLFREIIPLDKPINNKEYIVTKEDNMLKLLIAKKGETKCVKG
jgi:HSP20 family molecular chaperone IbpA